MKLLVWVKTHKLSSLLLGVILFYFVWNFLAGSVANYSMSRSIAPSYVGNSYNSLKTMEVPAGMPYSGSGGLGDSAGSISNVYTGNQNRMVQKESTISLLVKNVRDSANSVVKRAEELGGFMIQTNISSPGETSSATISIRIPTTNLNGYLNELRTLSIRVVSEEIRGDDITDQYKDIQTRLDTLTTTKKRFEEIYNKAVDIQDILSVQNNIMQLQDQIDSLKGQQQYMEKSTQTARVTVYLSTDELSLPYAPDTSWRPSAVFKEAVRSLVVNLRGLASLLIWIGVYVVFWGPVLILILVIRRYRRKRILR